MKIIKYIFVRHWKLVQCNSLVWWILLHYLLLALIENTIISINASRHLMNVVQNVAWRVVCTKLNLIYKTICITLVNEKLKTNFDEILQINPTLIYVPKFYNNCSKCWRLTLTHMSALRIRVTVIIAIVIRSLGVISMILFKKIRFCYMNWMVVKFLCLIIIQFKGMLHGIIWKYIKLIFTTALTY